MPRVNTRRLREGLGYSLNTWARALGVGRRTVMRWENDGVDPSPLALQQLKRFQTQLAEQGGDGETAPSTAPRRHAFEPITKRAGVLPGGTVRP